MEYTIIPYDDLEEMDCLTDEEYGRLVRAFLRYSITGEEPELTGSERFFWKMVRNRENRRRKNYEAKVQKNAQNGAKGGRPKKEETEKPNGYFEEPKKANGFSENPKNPTVFSETQKSQSKSESKSNIITPSFSPPRGTETPKAKPESCSQTLERLLPSYGIPQTMQDRVREWVQYKTERRQPYKEQGLKCLLRQIETNVAKYGEPAVVDIIEQSIAAQYQGIIFDKLKEPIRSPAKKAGIYDPSVYENAPQFGWGDD